MRGNPIIAIMLFIFLLAALIAIGTAPSYFTAMQKNILYLISFLGFGIALAFAMK
jgi:hypothetical protein